MTIRLDAGNLTQTRSDLGLAIGTDVLAPNGSAASLTAIPAAQITGTLPAVNGGSITDLDANTLGSGTVPDARFPATLPATSGVNLTALPATLPAASAANLTSIPAGNLTGSVADARLPANLQSFPAPGSDGNILTASSGAWTSAAAAAGGAWSVKASGSLSGVTNLDITGLTKTIALYFSNVKNSSDGIGPDVFFSTDNGSTFITTSTYDYSTMHADQNNQPGISLYAAGPGNDTNETHSGHFILYGPNVGTGIAQAITFSVIYPKTDGNAQFFVGGGYLPTASAVNAVRFRCATGATAGTYCVVELN